MLVEDTEQGKGDFKISNSIISGDFNKSFTTKHYPKAAKMLSLIDSWLTPYAGKVLVFHNTVHNSGTTLLEEVLKSNGYIILGDNPNPTTKSSNLTPNLMPKPKPYRSPTLIPKLKP